MLCTLAMSNLAANSLTSRLLLHRNVVRLRAGSNLDDQGFAFVNLANLILDHFELIRAQMRSRNLDRQNAGQSIPLGERLPRGTR